jgi:hypothetical protein
MAGSQGNQTSFNGGNYPPMDNRGPMFGRQGMGMMGNPTQVQQPNMQMMQNMPQQMQNMPQQMQNGQNIPWFSDEQQSNAQNMPNNFNDFMRNMKQGEFVQMQGNPQRGQGIRDFVNRGVGRQDRGNLFNGGIK